MSSHALFFSHQLGFYIQFCFMRPQNLVTPTWSYRIQRRENGGQLQKYNYLIWIVLICRKTSITPLDNVNIPYHNRLAVSHSTQSVLLPDFYSSRFYLIHTFSPYTLSCSWTNYRKGLGINQQNQEWCKFQNQGQVPVDYKKRETKSKRRKPGRLIHKH